MKRGQKPKPKHLHVMQGTARNDRHAGEDAVPEGLELGAPPESLDDEGLWFWNYAVTSWKDSGLTGDRVSLEIMARLWQRWQAAEQHIPEGGYFVCERTGNPKRHPAATEAMQCEKELRIVCESCGVTMPGFARYRREPADESDEDRMFGVS